jgi:hypothetical protein
MMTGQVRLVCITSKQTRNTVIILSVAESLYTVTTITQMIPNATGHCIMMTQV